MQNILVDGELMLYGFVGDDWDGFTAGRVIEALATMRGKPVNVRINSGGGYTDDGVSIYNALAMHDGDVTVYVDAMAASAASVIAMAGKKIIMRLGAQMMIHDPSVITVGNSKDHEKASERLEALAEGIAAIYAKRTGKTPADCRADMKEEIWLNADEAVKRGYADEIEGAAQPVAAFDYRIYLKAPNDMRAMATAKNWTLPTAATAANQEKPMTTPATPAAPAAAPTVDVAAIEAAAVARVTQIIEACNAAKEPAMAASLIREGLSLEQVSLRIAGAKDIREAVQMANAANKTVDLALADAYIAGGATVEKVRNDLFLKMATASDKQTIRPHLAAEGDDGDADGETFAGNAPVKKETRAFLSNVYAHRAKARQGRVVAS